MTPGEDGIGIGMRKEVVGQHSRWRKEHWQGVRSGKPESFLQRTTELTTINIIGDFIPEVSLGRGRDDSVLMVQRSRKRS